MNHSSDRKVPSPSTESRNDAIGEIGLVDQRLERSLSAGGREPSWSRLSTRPPREDLDVPRLVGRLHGQHLHHLAEMRMHLRDEAAGNDQRGRFVFDEIRHDLHDGVFDFVGEVELRVPRDRGFRIPLRGDGLRVNPGGVVRPHLDLVDQVEIELRRAGFDVAPRAASPHVRGGCSATASGRLPSDRRDPLRRRPATGFGSAAAR